MTSIAKAVLEAQIIQSLGDEAISSTPLHSAAIRRIDSYCGMTADRGADTEVVLVEVETVGTAIAVEGGGQVHMFDGVETEDMGEPDELVPPQETEQEPEEYEEGEIQGEGQPAVPETAAPNIEIDPIEEKEDGGCVLAGIDFNSDDDFLNSEEEMEVSSA